jgi:hypothetical protein
MVTKKSHVVLIALMLVIAGCRDGTEPSVNGSRLSLVGLAGRRCCIEMPRTGIHVPSRACRRIRNHGVIVWFGHRTRGNMPRVCIH